MNSSAFWCQLLVFPLLHFWNQQTMLKAQLLPGKDLLSLCTSYPFRDHCHRRTIVGDYPVLSSAQLLQKNISTGFMASQRGVSSCISSAFGCFVHTAASLDNTMVQCSGRPSGSGEPCILYTMEARAGSAFISPEMNRAC